MRNKWKVLKVLKRFGLVISYPDIRGPQPPEEGIMAAVFLRGFAYVSKRSLGKVFSAAAIYSDVFSLK